MDGVSTKEDELLKLRSDILALQVVLECLLNQFAETGLIDKDDFAIRVSKKADEIYKELQNFAVKSTMFSPKMGEA